MKMVYAMRKDGNGEEMVDIDACVRFPEIASALTHDVSQVTIYMTPDRRWIRRVECRHVLPEYRSDEDIGDWLGTWEYRVRAQGPLKERCKLARAAGDDEYMFYCDEEAAFVICQAQGGALPEELAHCREVADSPPSFYEWSYSRQMGLSGEWHDLGDIDPSAVGAAAAIATDGPRMRWYKDARALMYCGVVVRKFPRRATNIIEIMSKFEREHWNGEIANPLRAQEQADQATKYINRIMATAYNGKPPFRFGMAGDKIKWEEVEAQP